MTSLGAILCEFPYEPYLVKSTMIGISDDEVDSTWS